MVVVSAPDLTPRYRAFYDRPAPVEFDVEFPDDLDGPGDLRQFLLDEAPFVKLSAVRVEPVERDASVPPSSGGASGRSPVPEGDDTWAQVEALAALLEPEAFDADQPADEGWRKRTQEVALGHAAKVLAAGWRRVTEDPEPNAWRIEITVPLRLPVEQRHALFEAVCRAAEGWEPYDRDGWDTSVSGHPVYDDLLHDGSAVLRGGAE